MSGQRIGQYDAGSKLGEGGTRLERGVAIKVLPDIQELFRIPVLEAPIIHFLRGRLP